MQLVNNPNGILNPGRFVFYERMHTLTKELYARQFFKLLFRVTTRFLDTNDKAFENLYPIEVMVTSVYHCHLLLSSAAELPMTYSLERISEIAMLKPFADGNAVRIDECKKKILLFPSDVLGSAKILHNELQLANISGPAMVDVFVAVLVDNYILENLLTSGNERICVLAAQAASIRIFAPTANHVNPPGRYYQEMLQLGMKICNSVKKRTKSVSAEPSTSYKKIRLVTA